MKNIATIFAFAFAFGCASTHEPPVEVTCDPRPADPATLDTVENACSTIYNGSLGYVESLGCAPIVCPYTAPPTRDEREDCLGAFFANEPTTCADIDAILAACALCTES